MSSIHCSRGTALGNYELVTTAVHDMFSVEVKFDEIWCNLYGSWSELVAVPD